MSFSILNELLLLLIACNDESESVKMFAESKEFSLKYFMANFIAQSLACFADDVFHDNFIYLLYMLQMKN